MTLSVPTLQDLDTTGKTVFLRVDFNVPLQKGAIADDTRIRRALPTLEALRARAHKLILASHLGRPKGQVDPQSSLLPVAEHLAGLLGCDVIFLHDVTDPETGRIIEEAPEGSIFMLENLRFYPGEQAGDEAFAKQLADLADVYVDDAFGAMHRKDASIVAITAHLPSCAGLLVEAEIQALGALLGPTKRPFGAVLGGAKVSDKIGILERLAGKVDHLFLGGAMANTFLAALGKPTGSCRIEKDQIETARKIMDTLASRERELHLPTDFVVTDTFAADAPSEIVTEIAADKMALDIGPATLADWQDALLSCKTLFWNGPMGVAEWEAFQAGTEGVAKLFAKSDAFTVIGGGDSAAAIAKLGLAEPIDHISTGGGASLELIRDGDLVGLAALRRSK